MPEADKKAYEDYGILKTWKWELPEGSFPVPEHIPPHYYRCYYCENGRRHPEEFLVPFNYQGETVYVCRSCGTVYEYDPSAKKPWGVFRVWQTLLKQPYFWKYFSDTPGSTAYDFMHERGEITTHPLLDAHCGSGRAEAAETIVRYLIRMESGINEQHVSLFRRASEKCGFSRDRDALMISFGDAGGSFPNDVFSIFREGKDYFSLETSVIHRENIFGYTLDLNEDDWEYDADHLFCRFTYIGNDEKDLPADVKLLRRVPLRQEDWESRTCKTKGILRNPFGLDGFFLYEKKLDYHYFGTGEAACPWNDDDEDEDEE